MVCVLKCVAVGFLFGVGSRYFLGLNLIDYFLDFGDHTKKTGEFFFAKRFTNLLIESLYTLYGNFFFPFPFLG